MTLYERYPSYLLLGKSNCKTYCNDHFTASVKVYSGQGGAGMASLCSCRVRAAELQEDLFSRWSLGCHLGAQPGHRVSLWGPGSITAPGLCSKSRTAEQHGDAFLQRSLVHPTVSLLLCSVTRLQSVSKRWDTNSIT